MGSKRQAESSKEVIAAQKQVERWRTTRKKAGRMPEELWDLAVELSKVYGLNPIARALGLDYYSLKRRRVAADSFSQSAPAFVEVDMTTSGGSKGCVLEFEERRGAKLTVRLDGTVDVIALVESFWKRRR